MQEEEIEDIIGEVKYTDSQKSVTTTNVYSADFTDSSSDKNNSSSKETYVIDCDDSDDSDKTFQTNRFQGTVSLKDKAATQVGVNHDTLIENMKTNRSAAASQYQCSIVSQEIFTQTSKTIFELAQNENVITAPNAEGLNSLETQTSFLSITENRTVEYHINVIGDKTFFNPHQHLTNALVYNATFSNQMLTNSLEDKSSIYRESENEFEINRENLNVDSDDKIIKFVDDESQESVNYEEHVTQYENTSEFETSKYDSDIEEDSLENEYRDETDHNQDKSETSDIPKSVDNDIEDLYSKLSCCGDVFQPEKNIEPELPNVRILTPLTEETNTKKESITDMTPSVETLTNISKVNDATKEQIIKSKCTFNRIKCHEDQNYFRLPPINNNFSCPNSPLNFLFSSNVPNKLTKTNTLPLVSEDRKEKAYSRWGIDPNASGENPLLNVKNNAPKCNHSDKLQLPPIHHGEGGYNKNLSNEFKPSKPQTNVNQANIDSISIKGKIKELKMTHKRPRMASRSPSPTSTSCSPDETKLSDAAERGCEALCCELLRRLRLNSWCQALETLDELPKIFENFWSVISENRIAELIRQVSTHVDSPRTQVARTACNTLAEILKHTKYTKKPDFFEAIAILLIKTGSYCRPVRKAANVALDDVVCSVDVTQSVTAICVYGTGHKSALVRCASARLLVVCAAFAEGGRLLLRGRPPSAAAARRHVLRALSELLGDKNIDTRKYAERLYAMLRPLTNFEAYYLTDVDVDTASRQMKKYDHLLSASKQRYNNASKL